MIVISHMPMSNDFAYVTLVMKGDSYIPGALVLASSLRRTGNKADIICMVTPDVSEAAQSVLKLVYDEVLPVGYVYVSAFNVNFGKMQEYYHDMQHVILTKFNCFLLTKYQKVCLLDADIVVLRSLDAIFQLDAPAGIFSNYYIHGENDPYPRNMKFGDIVPRDCIMRSLEMQMSFQVSGSPLVLPTGEKIFTQFKSYLEDTQKKNGFLGLPNVCAGVDEQIITMFFTHSQEKNWRYVDIAYGCIPWKDKQIQPYLYHYVHKKPWTMTETEYEDLKPWFAEARYISDKYPETQQFFQFLLRTDVHENGEKLKTLLFRLRIFNE
jgi:alpha-N-acetylglucosamine transferase